MNRLIQLTLFLLVVMLSVTAKAYDKAYDFEVNGIYYNKSGTNATVTYQYYYSYGYGIYTYTSDYTGSVTIPETVTYNGTTYPVTGIEDYAFYCCSGLTSIDIPNSVTSIGNSAFYNCSGLTSVTIPNSVTSIGNFAFSYCSGLTRITVVSGNAKYDSRDNCNAIIETASNTLITGCMNTYIPNSVTSIGNSAFSGCSGLTSVTIPNSISSIGNYAFSGCSGLTSVTIGNSVSSISNYAFQSCTSLETLNFNAESCADFNFYSDYYPFNNTNISTINIGNSVQRIPGNFAYGLSKLASVTIGNSVTSIGNSAFYNCSGLTSVTIPNSVTSIGNSAFSGCSGLTSVTIPNSVTSIGNCAFESCSGLTSVTIPNSVTSIGNEAFWGCSRLTSIPIPNSVTSIGNNAFQGCTGLTRVEISNLSTWCKINFESPTTNPLYYAQHLYLNDDEVTNLVVPDDVEYIGSYTFYNCRLTSVKLHESVTSVGKQAFNNSPTIETVTCAAVTPPSWNALAMFTTNVYNHSPLYVPLGSERAYMADQCWGQFATIIGTEIHDEILATAISLNHSQMNLLVGGTSQLIATVLPDSTTNKVVTWSSSDSNIATVSSDGFVTAIYPGTATITATTTDGSNLSASCDVTVTEDLSNYDNYLSMSDTAAFRGDTIVIPIKMTNESSIISFQTDIFLPEGLELLQEDGEYIIDPSERMTRTHSIMSNDVSNGAIRVLCYSSNYKPFTGNSGDDLFYITVKVADNAEGNYTIQLKNTLLTNTDFVDLAAPDVAANVNVKAYLLGDANNSGTVSITDVVVTAQYVLELNPQPFVFEAADANADGNITVADVSRIAWMVLNPTLNAPLRAPALWNNGDRMSAEDITLASGETRRVSILLNNEMGYNAFQFDIKLPEGMTASNFHLTDRAGSHTFDVNMLQNGNIRALCYSPTMTAIDGHEGALLTFDVTAAGDVNGDITVDGIELVTAGCQSVKLDAFTIGVNNASSIKEPITGKAIAKVEYFNLAGQRMKQPSAGVTLIVTTYTDGSRLTSKVIR